MTDFLMALDGRWFLIPAGIAWGVIAWEAAKVFGRCSRAKGTPDDWEIEGDPADPADDDAPARLTQEEFDRLYGAQP